MCSAVPFRSSDWRVITGHRICSICQIDIKCILTHIQVCVNIFLEKCNREVDGLISLYQASQCFPSLICCSIYARLRFSIASNHFGDNFSKCLFECTSTISIHVHLSKINIIAN